MTKFRGFTKTELLNIYSNMLLSRRMDEKMLIILRQGKAFFHIGASGHEAAQTAAAMNFSPGKDWAYPYYRDQAFALQWGSTPEEIFLDFLAKKDGPSAAGRQMPQHYGNARLRIVSQSSPTGTQFLQAVGTAMGAVKAGTDEVVYVSSGEGTTSQGDFHEALNWAGRDKLPVIFHIENNKYAISVHIDEQTAGGSVFDIVNGYANLARVSVNGSDFFESHQAFAEAVQRARAGVGPTVIVSEVVRLLPHSSSDDHRKYRDPDELEKERQRDPILQFFVTCTNEGAVKKDDFDRAQDEIKTRVDQAAEWAETQADPDPETYLDQVYSPGLRSGTPVPPANTGEPIVLVDAINHALIEEMERNDKILVYGEDVADPKGGVFTATRGLSRFGKQRVFNSPLAESSIIGTAVGLAVHGFKPVVEIQFGDYIWTAMMQIRNELATMRYRSNGTFSAAVVVRVPVGGYIHGGLCHSQNIEGYFTHMPGVCVVYPSNSASAKGLLKAAIRGEDPVLFLEHKGLYRQRFAARPEPDADYLLPLGHAEVVQSGDDLTVITWGMMVQRSIEAVRMLSDLSPSVEIIDLQSLIPLDQETVLNSVKKTGKVLIIHEENLTGGFGAEIAARLASDAFEFLDAPVRRIAAADSPIPYHPVLEDRVLPQVGTIALTMKNLLLY